MIADKLFTLVAPVRPFLSSATVGGAIVEALALATRGRSPNRNELISIIRLLFQVVFAVALLPVSLPLYLVGCRVIYGNMLSQIGEVVLLDAEIKRRAILRERVRLVLILGPCRRGNRLLASRYAEHITVVDWPSPAAFLWCLISYNPLLQRDIVRYDAASNNSLMAKINRIWVRQGRQPLLSPELFDEAWDNIPKSVREQVREGRFVCLHSRDLGFYGDARKTTRNYNITDMIEVVNLLTSARVAVIRIGRRPEHRIDPEHLASPDLYFDGCDITTSIQDVYFLSNCLFYIGCSSGPAEVPMLFGRNALVTNTYSAVQGRRFWLGDLSIFKKLRSVETGVCLPLQGYAEPPFDRPLQRDRLRALGYELVDNTPDEILLAFADFLRKSEKKLLRAGLSCDRIFQASGITPPAPPADGITAPKLSRHHWTFRALGEFSPLFLSEYERRRREDMENTGGRSGDRATQEARPSSMDSEVSIADAPQSMIGSSDKGQLTC